MANEAERINNPDSTPAAVSTGYQLQNTNLVAQRVGCDFTVVTGGTGECYLEISGPVDVNGEIYTINSRVTFPLTTVGKYYIHLAGSGANLTPTIGTGANTFDADKNARYTDVGAYRVLNWIIYFNGTTAYVTRLLTPEQNVNRIAFGDGPLRPIGEPDETFIITSAASWTAPRSGYYKIYVGGPSEATAVKRIWIDLNDVWTTTVSSVLSSITNGVTTISVLVLGGPTITISGNDYARNYVFVNSSGSPINGFLIVG